MPALPLVPPQPPVAPLNAEAQQALADLQGQRGITKRLTHHLSQAANLLAVVAGQLNDRGTSQGVEYRKKRRRAEANAEEENQQEKTEYEDFQRKVQDLTRKMDYGVRAVVDDQNWVDALPDVMKEIARQAKASAVSQSHLQQRIDDGEEGDVANTYPPAPTADEVPSALIKAAREDVAAEWMSKTLTERYSQHNTYVGFYRMVHDAKNPGDDGLPIPHHSAWFANEEGANRCYVPPGSQARRNRQHRGSAKASEEEEEGCQDESSDVEIARERISIKCPITFLPFTDPLTSTKCPHSFDRPGIMEMLRRTQTSLPLTDAQTAELAGIPSKQKRERRAAELRTPAIACPICSILLAESDLRPDPVLLRKVQRVQEAEAREMEGASSDTDSNSASSEGDDDGIRVAGRGTQSKPVGLGSSPGSVVAAGKTRTALKMKQERARSQSRAISMVPQTQLEGDEDEEMEDE